MGIWETRRKCTRCGEYADAGLPVGDEVDIEVTEGREENFFAVCRNVDGQHGISLANAVRDTVKQAGEQQNTCRCLPAVASE